MRRRKVAPACITVHPTHVVSRQSTDNLALDDPVVVRALRFIRDNANKDLRVGDLPSASGVSRRARQDRFKLYLGRTPMEEIHRCRVERIARLLVETNMTIGELAAASGFEIGAHVSRFFSRHTGLTPLEYRRRNRLPRGCLGLCLPGVPEMVKVLPNPSLPASPTDERMTITGQRRGDRRRC